MCTSCFRPLLLIPIMLAAVMGGCPAPDAAGGDGNLNPDTFRGIALVLDAPRGVVATIDLSDTVRMHLYGRIGDDLLPRDIYQAIIVDRTNPQNDIGVSLDSRGRTKRLVVGGMHIADYSYSDDGRIVTETRPGQAPRQLAINGLEAPQDTLDRLSARTSVNLFNFFDRFPTSEADLPAKGIRSAERSNFTVAIRALNVTISVAGVVVSGIGLVAMGPGAGAALVLVNVAGHTAALLSLGVTLSQALDRSDRIGQDEAANAIALGSSLVGLGTATMSVGLTGVERGIVVLNNRSEWVGFVVAGVDSTNGLLQAAALPSGQGANAPGIGGSSGGTGGSTGGSGGSTGGSGGSTGGSGGSTGGSGGSTSGSTTPTPASAFTVLHYLNINGSSGSSAALAQLKLTGSASAPQIGFQGSGVIALAVVSQNGEYLYAIGSDGDGFSEPDQLPTIPFPLTYGNYAIPGLYRIDVAPAVAPVLKAGVIYTITISDIAGGGASLTFRVN
ncbi:MAG: hypothetical protein IPM64_16625 [Phycisphaerales bacterium]|nr:hypothetical protein [Phycisphaerales bacterium]